MTAFWRTLGQGPRPCLALHCSLAHSAAWRGVSEGLDHALTLVAPDFPGHGKSAGPVAAEDHVEQAIVCAAEGLTAPMDVVAHSFGAYVALRLAMRFPEKVKSLWLYEPVFMASVRDSHADLHSENAAQMRLFADLIATGERATAARKFMDIWGDGSAWDTLAPEAQCYFQRCIPQPCRIQPWVADDVSGSLKRLADIKVPVLLVDGEFSPPIMGAVQDSLAARLPNATRATVAGASHMGVVTHAQECGALIAQHLGLT